MLHIIANVLAGNGRALRTLTRAERYLTAKAVPYQVHISEYPGHAIELARDLCQEPEATLVALGGDGTVAEVAQGMLGSRARMGIIPAGSGNDYRRTHRIPHRVKKAVDIILGGYVHRVDLMELQGHIYVNIFNSGFDLLVAEHAARRKALGKLAYFFSLFEVLPHYKSRHLRLTMDDTVVEKKVFLCCAGCGSYYGGGMFALPGSDPSDGLLEICVIDEVTVPQVLRLLPLFMLGKHYAHPVVHIYHAKTLRIESLDGPLSLGGDGEVVHDIGPATVTLLPGALSLLVPQP